MEVSVVGVLHVETEKMIQGRRCRIMSPESQNTLRQGNNGQTRANATIILFTETRSNHRINPNKQSSSNPKIQSKNRDPDQVKSPERTDSEYPEQSQNQSQCQCQCQSQGQRESRDQKTVPGNQNQTDTIRQSECRRHVR